MADKQLRRRHDTVGYSTAGQEVNKRNAPDCVVRGTLVYLHWCVSLRMGQNHTATRTKLLGNKQKQLGDSMDGHTATRYREDETTVAKWLARFPQALAYCVQVRRMGSNSHSISETVRDGEKTASIPFRCANHLGFERKISATSTTGKA